MNNPVEELMVALDGLVERFAGQMSHATFVGVLEIFKAQVVHNVVTADEVDDLK